MEVDHRWTAIVRKLSAELRLAGWLQGLRVGMEVETTGLDATRGWRGYEGVVEAIEGETVLVHFDDKIGIGTIALTPREVRPRVRWSHSDAICEWEMEHHQ